jgi:hypothetical protein
MYLEMAPPGDDIRAIRGYLLELQEDGYCN